MVNGLSRYDLRMINEMHDQQGYMCVDQEYLAQQLRRIGLLPNASRFEVAERVRQLERES